MMGGFTEDSICVYSFASNRQLQLIIYNNYIGMKEKKNYTVVSYNVNKRRGIIHNLSCRYIDNITTGIALKKKRTKTTTAKKPLLTGRPICQPLIINTDLISVSIFSFFNY